MTSSSNVHPTPAASASLACSLCGQGNGTDRRFCGSCGARLWEPCAGCGRINPIDQRFCGGCGADLEDVLQEKRQSLQVAVDHADRLAESGRFVDAAEKLRGLAVPDHSQLQAVAAEVRRRIATFPQARDAALAEARRAHQDAQQFAEARDFRRAYERLNRILPAFQTAEMRELLRRLESTVEEAKQLKADVQKAVTNKAYDGLLAKVERLVQLEPSGEKLEKLLAQLRGRQRRVDSAQAAQVLKQAEQALKECKYAVAQAALQQFPPEVDEELLRRKRDACERLWLADQLRTAPRLSPVLIEISKRLKDLQPQDGRAAELHEELSRRWKRLLDSHGRSPNNPPTWAKPPAEYTLGLPVDLAPLPHLLANFAASPPIVLREFLVAFGLALQGVGSAAIGFNLAPRQQGSWLEKVARLKSAKSRCAAWGLDFGATSLKAVRLILTSTDKKRPPAIRIDEAVEIPFDNPGSTTPEADNESAPPEAAAFERLRAEKEISDECLVVGLPGVQSLVRFFKLPPAKPDKLAEAVQYEVRASVPLGEDELIFGSHFGSPETPSGNGSGPLVPVIAVAASRTHASARIEWLGDRAGPSTVVQSSCVAIVNALRHGGAFADASSAPTQAIVDIGAETLSVIVDEGGLFWFRSSYDGVKRFDDALARKLQLTRQQAAQLRKRPAAARQMHRADEILQPCFEDLRQAIRRGLDQYQRERNRSVDCVYLCGGGAQQFGLLRHLWFGS